MRILRLLAIFGDICIDIDISISASISAAMSPSQAAVSSPSSPRAPRVALVTGAAQGIGRGIALRLAQDGYLVAACDLPSNLQKLKELERDIKNNLRGGVEEGINEGEKRFVSLIGDVSKEEEVKRMVEKCVEALGSLDVVRFF